MIRNVVRFVLLMLFVASQLSGQIYVAPNGDDDNSGSIDQPYATFPKAISEVTPGDTIYARGGVYTIQPTITISAARSGTPDQYCVWMAYEDELPILDFSSQSMGSKGVSLRSNYWHIKGLDFTGAGDNGMEINFGSNNIIERCNFYRNRDTGLQLSNGSAHNKIINCDSYFNYDPPDYGDADGFAPKLTVGDSNAFYGCRAWTNCDDGWDGYLRGASDVTTILENCWTWGNGYLEDGTDPGPQANGNGFKMGGGDNSNGDSLMHHNVLINCVAFANKNKGFDQNNNLGSMTLLQCSGFDNQTANYRIQRALVPGQTLTIKNSLSYQGAVQLGSFAVQETNSWLGSFVVNEDDFLSLSIDSADAPRKSDGSLPDIAFLHLVENSDLVDAGVDLGFAYNGVAPDLGAFETGNTTAITTAPLPDDFQLHQNYPNPFNPSTTIAYSLDKPARVTLAVFDVTGRQVATLVNGARKGVGEHSVTWKATDNYGNRVANGVYFYRFVLGDVVTATRKMVLIK